MSTTLDFYFTFDNGNAVIRLTKNNECAYMTKLETSYTTPPTTSPMHATVLDQIANIVTRVSSAPSSIPHNTEFHNNDQLLAQIVAWTTTTEDDFKRCATGLQYDDKLLLDFATKQKCEHVIKMLTPQERTVTMCRFDGNTRPYQMSFTVRRDHKHMHSVTCDIAGKLNIDELQHASMVIGIMRTIIANEDAACAIKALRREVSFEESAFVYIAKLVNNTHLDRIKAAVREGNSYSQYTLDSMVF